MRGLDRWFEQHAERAEGRVALEDALLAGRFYAYAYYRLRFFLGRTLLGTLVHFIEFYFLILMFDGWQLTLAVMIRAAESLISGWWWGGLEVMRERIRELAREKRNERIPQVLASWMAAARYYAALALAAACGWVLFDVARPSQHFDVFHLFVLVAGVRLALGFVTRTYHSGAFAMRRVYRPFGVVIAIDLFGALGTAMLWPLLAAHSLPIVSLITTLVASALTYIYVRRVYDFIGINGPRSSGRRKVRSSLRETFSSEFQAAGWANAAMSLDGLLVFVLAFGSAAHPQNAQLFFLFYLISPLLRASHDWARLFYFDLKRLDLDLFTNVLRRFSRQLFAVAVVAGGMFWLLASVAGTIGVGRNLGWMYLLLAALFMVRALLAFYQVQSFSQKRYVPLIASGALIVAVLVMSTWAGPGGLARIGLLACGLAPVAVCLRLFSRRKHRDPAAFGLISPAAWLSRVASLHEPVRVRTIRLTRGTPDHNVEQFALEIARRIGSAGDVSLLHGGHIGWFERGPDDVAPDATWLLSHGAGLVDALHDSPRMSSGRKAIAEAQRATRLLGTVESTDLSDTPTALCESLVERFQRTCPAGIYWDAAGANGKAMKSLASVVRRDVMRSAVDHAKNFFAPPRADAFEVTTFCDRGEMQLIFAIPKSVHRKVRANWKSFIDSVNVRSAVGTLTIPKENPRMFLTQLRTGSVWFSAVGAIASLVFAVKVDHAVNGEVALKSAARTEIRAPAAAFLQSVQVSEGDGVATSTPVARLNIPDLDSKIAQSKANLREVEAELRMLDAGSRPEEVQEQRRVVALLEREVKRCQNDVQSSEGALAEQLASLEKQAEEWQAEFDFCRATYQRRIELHKTRVVSEEEIQEVVKDAKVAKARLEQIAAEQRMVREEGTIKADGCLAESRQDLVEAKAILVVLEAGSRPEEIEAARARREAIEEELRYLEQLSTQLVLHAGAEGIVTTAGVNDLAGTYLEEGDLICSVEDPSIMKAEIMINEGDANRVCTGQTVRLKFRCLPYESFAAKVEAIAVATALDEEGKAVTTASDARMLVVRCCVADEQGRLRPGMTGYAKISLGPANLASIAYDKTSRFVSREFWW